jgi:hypothetical protein
MIDTASNVTATPPLDEFVANDKPAARPTFILQFKPEPHCSDPTRAVRRLLKIALRRFALRAVSVEELPR